MLLECCERQSMIEPGIGMARIEFYTLRIGLHSIFDPAHSPECRTLVKMIDRIISLSGNSHIVHAVRILVFSHVRECHSFVIVELAVLRIYPDCFIMGSDCFFILSYLTQTISLP